MRTRGPGARSLVRKRGLEPLCLSAPPPQDGVSANFTTSALKNRFIFNYLMSTPLSASVRCIHFCHYLLQPTIGKKLSASQIRQTGKQGVDSVRLRMDVTHRRFDVIVPGCVLQCELAHYLTLREYFRNAAEIVDVETLAID